MDYTPYSNRVPVCRGSHLGSRSARRRHKRHHLRYRHIVSRLALTEIGRCIAQAEVLTEIARCIARAEAEAKRRTAIQAFVSEIKKGFPVCTPKAEAIRMPLHRATRPETHCLIPSLFIFIPHPQMPGNAQFLAAKDSVSDGRFPKKTFRYEKAES